MWGFKLTKLVYLLTPIHCTCSGGYLATPSGYSFQVSWNVLNYSRHLNRDNTTLQFLVKNYQRLLLRASLLAWSIKQTQNGTLMIGNNTMHEGWLTISLLSEAFIGGNNRSKARKSHKGLIGFTTVIGICGNRLLIISTSIVNALFKALSAAINRSDH